MCFTYTADVPNDPSPNEYQRHLADKQTLPCSPAFTHQLRREGTVLWGVTGGLGIINDIQQK